MNVPHGAVAHRGTAICDECGTTRKYKRPRNHIYQDQTTWAREIGDLKCVQCDRITRHALIVGSDWEEHHDEVLRGRLPSADSEEMRRRRAAYRRAQEQNPRLLHTYSAMEGNRARADGSLVATAYCGASVEIAPKRTADISRPWTADVAPKVSEDDLSTFLTSWVSTDCPDCEFVHNREALKKQRERLRVLMTTALCELLDNSQAGQYDAHVGDLIALLQRVHGQGGVQ